MIPVFHFGSARRRPSPWMCAPGTRPKATDTAASSRAVGLGSLPVGDAWWTRKGTARPPRALTQMCWLTIRVPALVVLAATAAQAAGAAPRHAAMSGAGRRIHVSYFCPSPRAVAYSCTLAPAATKAPVRADVGGAKPWALSRLLLVRAGKKIRIWNVVGPTGNSLRYLRRRNTMVWCTMAKFCVATGPEWSLVKRFGPRPPNMVFLPNTLSVGQGARLAVVGVIRFQPAAFYLDLIPIGGRGRASVRLRNMPVSTVLCGTVLLVGGYSPSGKRYWMDRLNVTREDGKLDVRLVSHSSWPGRLVGAVGRVPVSTAGRGRKVFIGRRLVATGAPQVWRVACSGSSVFLIGVHGQFGLLRKPGWKYRRAGWAAPDSVLGLGRWRRGFWLARRGGRFLLIGTDGSVRASAAGGWGRPGK